MNDSSSPLKPAQQRRVKRLVLIGLGAATLATALLAAAVFGLLPWLGRRGSLNSLIEEILSSSLTVPIRIAHIDSHPLSQFTVTELRSVEFEAEDRLRFATQEISLTYKPLELLEGRLRKLQLERPEVLIHIGSDLASVAQLPSADAGTTWGVGDEALLPVTIDTLLLVDATVTVQLDGRRTQFDGLELEVDRLGWKVGQAFRLEVAAFGGKLHASGQLDVGADKSPRYTLKDVRVSLVGVQLADVLDWLAPGAIAASKQLPQGQLSLKGTLAGVWPERLELHLESTADKIAVSPAPQLQVSEGDVGLRLDVAVSGEFDRVAFQLQSHARAAWSSPDRRGDDRATLRLDAEYLRDARGGKLLIPSLRFQLRDDSHVEITGEVRAPVTHPELQLTVSAGGLDVAEVLGHLEHHTPLSKVWRQIKGKVSFDAQITGPAARPSAEGRFEVVEIRYADPDQPLTPGVLSGAFGGLRADPEQATIDCDWAKSTLRSENARETIEFTRKLAPNLELGDFSVDGPIELRLESQELHWPYRGEPIELAADLRWQANDLHTPFLDARKLDVEWHFGTRWLPTEVTFQTQLTLAVEEFLTGPLYYSPPAAEKFQLRGHGKLSRREDGRLQHLEIIEAELETPMTGPVKATATFPFDAQKPPRFLLEALDIPLNPAFSFFVVEPFRESFPFLETLQASGAATITLASQPDGGTLGRFQLTDGDIVCGRLQLAGCALTLPFLVGGQGPLRPEPGSLRARRISRGFVTAGGVDVPFELEGRTYRLSTPIQQELLGGVLDIPSVELSLTQPIELTAVVKGRGFDLGEITTSANLSHIPGEVSLELTPLSLRGNDLECAGLLTINAFSGQLELSDISLNNLLEPYSNLSLRHGSLSGVDLGELGKVFHAGLLSGILDGDVTDVAFTAGDLTSFNIDVQTVPRPGVPQFVDRRAIETLRSIVAGHVGALEKTLVSRFLYGKFGFQARLVDEKFHIRGKYPQGDKEYIMYPYWYQLPRITIVNSQPTPYPWEAILEQFERIYSEDDA